ncbi:MAG: hypothetical protein BroJett018_21140 [Chloroflexota bacterium]|nr:hypothetical protein [Chloroflexota bacterium]GIK64320.1 MAG: hypothetical protein BroJett018_21140 [Chloroflexota bacterium]
MNLSDLQEAVALLSAATLADPLLALCSSLAWLDPLVAQEDLFADDETYLYADTRDDWINIALAWEMTRQCFPTVYAETTLALRHEINGEQLADQVCQGINRQILGGELHDLEQIHFGLPFFGIGIDLTSPEFFAETANTPLRQVYAMLGVPVGGYAIPDSYHPAAQVAHVLAYSLRQTGDPNHINLAWLLDWMFAQTGNTAADYTDDDLYEMGLEPLPWQPDEVEFNALMHAEAAEIIGFARQGMAHLLSTPALQITLRANFEKVTRSMRKVKRYDFTEAHAHRLANRLRWADGAEPVDAGRANPDFETLSLRGADAA